MPCPGIDDLERFALRSIEGPDSQRIEVHLGTCSACRSTVEDISENLKHLDRVRDALRALPAVPEPAAPEWIGAFRVVREIGRGGMGVVYLAEQEHPQREVALKVLRPGAASPETLRRFEHEARALGRLRHAGIATIYSAGVARLGRAGAAEDVPYFAMELVRGERLDRFVRDRDLNVRDRLRILALIAEAVHSAHLNGVIHRDLKPGNILVEPPRAGATGTEGPALPKILDFGVARATGPDRDESLQTVAGQILGTVPYMSPEQLGGGAVDARSDVYALGVIGYEILAGRSPLDLKGKALPEAARMLRDEDPRPLGRIDPRFSGDIEAIIGRALAKNPEERYQSASELAADIRLWLAGEPVSARSPGLSDVLRRIVRRHRLGSILAAVLLLLLVGYGITTGVLLGRARRSEARARLETRKAETTSEFLTSLFMASTPYESQGDIPSALELVDRGAARVRGELADQPEVRAALLKTLGSVYILLGRLDPARELLDESLALHRDLYGRDHVESAEVLYEISSLEQAAGNHAAAESLLAVAGPIFERERGPDHEDIASVLTSLGLIEQSRDGFAAADSLLREALALQERRVGPDHEDVATARHVLASVREDLGAWAEAESLYTLALETRRRVHGDDHSSTLVTMANLASLHLHSGDFAAAEVASRKLRASWIRMYGPDHLYVARETRQLAIIRSRLGDPAGSIALHRESLAILRRSFDGDHPQIAEGLNALGSALQRRGDLDSAETGYRESAAMFTRLYGPDHEEVFTPVNNLATVFQERGDHASAIPLLLRCLSIMRRTYGDDHLYIGKVLNNVGKSWTGLSRFAEADSFIGAALAMRRRLFGDDHPEVATSLHSLGELRLRQGLRAEAEEPLREALRIRVAALGEEHFLAVETRKLLEEATRRKA